MKQQESACAVDKILKGTKPADIPVQRANKFEPGNYLKIATCLPSPFRGRCFCARTRPFSNETFPADQIR